MATTATSHKTAAESFLTLVASGEVRRAYDTYVGAGFKHHNAYFPAAAEALLKGMEDNARQNPQKRIEIKQTIEEGDRVAVFSHVRHNPAEPGYALVHIFRFAGDRIVEMWDVVQEVPAQSPNTSGVF
jgi:predicted SnoaL-like aldol condensation-catalyzing enzyme